MANRIKKLFIGPLSYLREAPLPAQGMTTEQASYAEMMQLESGGAVGIRSAQYHQRYNLSFVGTTEETKGIDHYPALRSGVYGSGLLYFNNPYDYGTNLLAPGWAAPGLQEQGWYSIGNPASGASTYANSSGTTAYNQPPRSLVYTWSGGAGAPVALYRQIVVIPPDQRLVFGWSGSLTGVGTVTVRPITVADGVTYGTAVAVTPLNANAATRTNVSFDGNQYKAVEIYISRTSTAAASVTITSMTAQLQPLSSTLAHVTGPWQRGNGHTGCMFSDDAVVENYVYMHPPRKGISTTLEEVGAWLR